MKIKIKNPSLVLRTVLIVVSVCLIGSALLFAISAAVCNKTVDHILSFEKACQSNFDCILVLGCRVWDDGSMSAMLADRVSVGVSLYQDGAAPIIFMSGDSEHAEKYDEVGTMKSAAEESGIPVERILTDPHGLSTYDSLIRLRDVYGMKRVLIVTQEYHLYRALYIAEKLGMEARGVSANLRTYQKQIFRELREIPARVKDVYSSLIQPPPKYES